MINKLIGLFKAKKKFKSRRPHYEHLRTKWEKMHRDVSDNLNQNHLHNIAVGSLGGLMLLTQPTVATIGATPINHSATDNANHTRGAMVDDLKSVVPTDMRNLSHEEETQVAEKIEAHTGIKVAAEIDNKRLNRTFGLIGGEQHLYRYPGDTVEQHAKDAADWAMYGGSGIAPGLGAWGYFAPSKAAFDADPQNELRERYYVAVQTFLSPGFAERFAEYRDFYKYRKMLVVNPKTGQSVVAVIADAGPSEWTGKHLGGSPEVMEAVGLAGGPRKGAVLYYFIADDQNVNLGPVNFSPDNLANKI